MTDRDELERRLALVKVGAWYSTCCYLDLYEIETEEHAEDIREAIRDGIRGDLDADVPNVWATEREGLLFFRDLDPSDREGIDQRMSMKSPRQDGSLADRIQEALAAELAEPDVRITVTPEAPFVHRYQVVFGVTVGGRQFDCVMTQHDADPKNIGLAVAVFRCAWDRQVKKMEVR